MELRDSGASINPEVQSCSVPAHVDARPCQDGGEAARGLQKPIMETWDSALRTEA
jgi:hypothetical protein